MTDLERVAADLARQTGEPWTLDEAAAYLHRFGLTPDGYFAQAAEAEATMDAHVEPPIPDPERDPIGWAQYQHMVNPQG